MTPITVLDTSVTIDLHRGGLLDAFFKLPSAYVVPTEMFADELEDWCGQALLDHGLQVRPLDEKEVALAQEYLRRYPSLSLVDAYALALAANGGHTMLAGARDIRELGLEIGLEVRGVLHVFDLIEEAQLLSPASLYSCLTIICRSRRRRLPESEVQARLKKYELATAWPPKCISGGSQDATPAADSEKGEPPSGR